MFETRNIICQKCGSESEFFLHGNSPDPKLCNVCDPPKINFRVQETVNFKNYKKNGGNVSAARIKMVKSRKVCPDGNGEVVMIDRGRITDRPAYNY